MNKRLRCWVVVASAGLLAGCVAAPTEPWLLVGRHAMVASDSAAASQVGADVLRRGGNAIDAAVATSFALAVTRPQSTGLGGGGFLIYRRAADGEIFVQDFREQAPRRATRDMFVEARQAQGSDAPVPSRVGYLAVAVPGLVKGRLEALERWGTMPLDKLTRGAIRLAREGFVADEAYVKACREVTRKYEQHTER